MNLPLLILLAHVPFAVVALASNLGPLSAWILAGLCLLVLLSYLAAIAAVRFIHALAMRNDRS